jgi:hypothetical protein|tara:strand:- start:1254 stop:1622 length:369 start_codon:yes stop_codon:yes gene_type:complete
MTIKHKTRKRVPWAGWGKISPKGKQRTRMYRKCGKKCFLGKKTKGNKQHPSFPICAKNTCKINSKGLYAAYIRARQWGKPKKSYKKRSHPRYARKTYKRIANTAKRMLKKRGYKVGKTRKRR